MAEIEFTVGSESLLQNVPLEIQNHFRALPKELNVYQVPLEAQPFQPWAKHPKPSAWFNQNLTPETWKAQSEHQNNLRDEIIQKQTQSSKENK